MPGILKCALRTLYEEIAEFRFDYPKDLRVVYAGRGRTEVFPSQMGLSEQVELVL